MPYLTTAQYPAIRAALDVTLTEAQLPNTVIAAAPYHPAAEAEVARRLGALAEDAEGAAGAQRAVLYLTAARLLPALPAVTRRVLGDTAIQYAAPAAAAERAAGFRRAAAAELDALLAELGGTPAATAPTVFTLAGRGGARAEGTAVPA